MRAGVLAGSAPPDSLAREVKEPSISEAGAGGAGTLIEALLRCSLAGGAGAGDLRLERDIVSFVCLGFTLAAFFVGLGNVGAAFLRLTDGLRGGCGVSENFLLSPSSSAFLLLAFLLLASAIAATLAASGGDIFSEKAPV